MATILSKTPQKIESVPYLRQAGKKPVSGQNVQNLYPFSDHDLKTIMLGAKHLYSLCKGVPLGKWHYIIATASVMIFAFDEVERKPDFVA